MTVSLTSTLSPRQLDQSGGETTARVTIEGAQHGKQTLATRHIALCIDASGSMGRNEKIDNAKAGARRVLDLLGPDDYVSVITFDSTVRTWIEGSRWGDLDREVAERAIDDIAAGAKTDIYGGLTEAWEELQDAPEASHAAQKIILLSDGHDSYRDDPEKFRPLAKDVAADGISIMTAGIGMYDDVLMAELADLTDGLSTHLTAAEDIEEFLRETVEAAADMVAANPELRIADGDAFKLLEAYLHEPEVKARELREVDGGVAVGLPDIIADQPQTVVLRFVGQPRASGGTMEVADLSVYAEGREFADHTLTVEYADETAGVDESVERDFDYARIAAAIKNVQDADDLQAARKEIRELDDADLREELEGLLGADKTEI